MRALMIVMLVSCVVCVMSLGACHRKPAAPSVSASASGVESASVSASASLDEPAFKIAEEQRAQLQKAKELEASVKAAAEARDKALNEAAGLQEDKK